MRRFLWLVPVVALFVGGGIALFTVRPAAELGAPAPGFELPQLGDNDTHIAIDDVVGDRPVVVNFWASWCEPCKDEARDLAAVARKYDGDVDFLGVTILDGEHDALAFARRYDVPYRSVRDARGTAAKRYGVTGVPETVFIDRDGNLVGKFVGSIERKNLETLVRDLIDLPPGDLLEVSGRGETRPVP